MFDSMSLEEMKTYRGADEVPKDFDDFREKQLKSIEIPKYKLNKKEYNIKNVDCYELKFKTGDNSVIYSKCMFPKSIDKIPVIYCFHGYESQSRPWSYFMKYLIQGYGIVTMDVRGQAGKSSDGGSYTGITSKAHIIRGIEDGRENLFFTRVYKDLYTLMKIVESFDFVDNNRLYSNGGSQGGALALIAAAFNKKIKKTVVQYPFLSDFRRVISWQSHEEPYDELYVYFKYKDPFHHTEEQIINTLSYIDVKNFAHLIKSKVTMITGLEDIICFPSTQYAIYNRLETEKEIYNLPEYGHEPINVYVDDFMLNKLTDSTIEIY